MQFTHGTTSETTYYIGGLMEMVVGSSTTFRHIILGGNGPVALLTRPATGTATLRYVLGDHQGSTEAFLEGGGSCCARGHCSAAEELSTASGKQVREKSK